MKLRITIDDQIYAVEVGDLNTRPIHVTVDGDAFDVWPEEDGKAAPAAAKPAAAQAFAGPVTASAAAPDVTKRSGAVCAPIPGVILSVSVKEGDTVSFGQELCVLEAMKMKNVIRANRTGKIAAICVAGGDQVKHNQVLMEYTD